MQPRLSPFRLDLSWWELDSAGQHVCSLVYNVQWRIYSTEISQQVFRVSMAWAVE